MTGRKGPKKYNTVTRTNVMVNTTGDHGLSNIFLNIGDKSRANAFAEISKNELIAPRVYLNGEDIGFLTDGPETPQTLQIRVVRANLGKVMAKTTLLVVKDGDGIKALVI